MDALDRARAELEGGEFDWLLIDSDGALALCETAGFGEVPDLVLSQGALQLDGYSDAIRLILDSLSESGTCHEENKGVGADSETLGYGTRGLYVYDWKHWSGPYQRIVVPDNPTQVSAIEPILRSYMQLISSAPIAFASTGEFQLGELLPCRKLRAG